LYEAETETPFPLTPAGGITSEAVKSKSILLIGGASREAYSKKWKLEISEEEGKGKKERRDERILRLISRGFH